MSYLPTCVGTDSDLTVPFCCSTTIPEGFTPPDLCDSGTIRRLIYRVDCLKCIKEKCERTVETPCGPTTLRGFQVKIVGCIPFMASLFPVTGDCGGKFNAYGMLVNDDKKVNVCCHGCVCVDKNICCLFKDDDDHHHQFKDPCPELTCDNVTATLNVSIEECDSTGVHIVKFTGTFTIPGCDYC